MNFYEILKTKKLGRGSPDYWTQLFSEHVGGKGEWKVAGVLPLTFTAKAGNAVDWVIYGNDELGENQFGFVANDFITSEIIAGAAKGCILTGLIPNENYTMTTNAPRQTIGANIWFGGGSTENDGVWDGHPRTKSADNDGQIIVYMRTSEIENLYGNYWFMVTKGSVAPDHYIPYQQGVGERTANLFDVSKFEGGNTHVSSSGLSLDISNQTVIINQTSTAQYPQVYITDSNGQALQLQESETYSIKIDKQNIPEGSHIYVILRAMSSGTERAYDTVVNQKIVTIPSGLSNWRWLLVAERNNITYDNCTVRIDVRKSNDIPSTYIPYGYEIPLTVSQQGQTDKNYDIYIGDSPLTEGETVNKTNTGVDIELFEGENTVSTTLYNKPTMEIKYK